MSTRAQYFFVWIFIITMLSGCPKPTVTGTFTPKRPTLESHGNGFMELKDEDLTFVDSHGVKWVAPQGVLTDGASVPRFALPVTDGRFSQEFLNAAIVHDAYCQKENKEISPDQYQKKPWREVHKMFYEACIAGGTSLSKAKIMFAAVWWFGPRWNDPGSRGMQSVSDDIRRVGFAGRKNWIEKNAPTIEEIEADLNRREPLLLEFNKYEIETSRALKNGNTNKADALLRKENAFIAKELENSPDDLMLLNFKGYFHKKRASLYLKRNELNEMKKELNKSERAFKRVIKNEPKDLGALNGLGSVSILRNEPERAEAYKFKALAIDPDYQAPKRDFQLMNTLRLSQPGD